MRTQYTPDGVWEVVVMCSRWFYSFVLALAVLCGAAYSSADPRDPIGVIESEGTMACWPKGKKWTEFCELSGAVRPRPGQLVVATDERFEGTAKHSPVWRTRFPRNGGPTPREEEYLADAFTKSIKFEGMACSPDARRVTRRWRW